MDLQVVLSNHWVREYVLEGYEVGYEDKSWTVVNIEGDHLIIKLQTIGQDEMQKVTKDKCEWIKKRKFEDIPYNVRTLCLNNMRKRFKKGTFVTLLKMEDPFNKGMNPGLLGSATGVDDIGSIQVRWENGSGLSVVYGEDAVAIIDKEFRFIIGDIIQFDSNNEKYAVILNLGEYGLVKELSTGAKVYIPWIQKEQGKGNIKAKKIDRLPDHMAFDL